MSSACALWLTFASLAAAHEVNPTIIDMTSQGQTLTFEVGVNLGANLEGFVAGVDFSTVVNTDEAAQAERYDVLRAMSAEAFEAEVRAFWPEFAAGITVMAGDTALAPQLSALMIPEPGNVEVIRESVLVFTVEVPAGTDEVRVGWDPRFGEMVLRKQDDSSGYAEMITGGNLSSGIALSGG